MFRKLSDNEIRDIELNFKFYLYSYLKVQLRNLRYSLLNLLLLIYIVSIMRFNRFKYKYKLKNIYMFIIFFFLSLVPIVLHLLFGSFFVFNHLIYLVIFGLLCYISFVCILPEFFIKNNKMVLLLLNLVFVVWGITWALYWYFYFKEGWLVINKLYFYWGNLIEFTLYIDSLCILFVLIALLIYPLSIYADIRGGQKNIKSTFILFTVLQIISVLFFLVDNMLVFYICFESALLPMLLILLRNGSQKRKIHASYMFWFFTLLGSLFLLIGIIFFRYYTGTFNYSIWVYRTYFNIEEMGFSKELQGIIWFCFFLGFGIKIPIFPFYSWLPEAHVEASTGGSMVLSGILLKFGSYGMLRLVINLFPRYSESCSMYVIIICLFSIVYASYLTIRLTDIKKIIAYSSIIHMNFTVLGLFVLKTYGVSGAIFSVLSHSLVSPMLFFCAGTLYSRYKTRNILYYGKLSHTMPKFSYLFFLGIIFNAGVPVSCCFVSEYVLLYSICSWNYIAWIGLSTSLFFNTVYTIWIVNRICFGEPYKKKIKTFKDVNRIDFFVLIQFVLSIVFLGLLPDWFFISFQQYGFCDLSYD